MATLEELHEAYLVALKRVTEAQAANNAALGDVQPIGGREVPVLTAEQIAAQRELADASDDYEQKRDAYYAARGIHR